MNVKSKCCGLGKISLHFGRKNVIIGVSHFLKNILHCKCQYDILVNHVRFKYC